MRRVDDLVAAMDSHDDRLRKLEPAAGNSNTMHESFSLEEENIAELRATLTQELTKVRDHLQAEEMQAQSLRVADAERRFVFASAAALTRTEREERNKLSRRFASLAKEVAYIGRCHAELRADLAQEIGTERELRSGEVSELRGQLVQATAVMKEQFEEWTDLVAATRAEVMELAQLVTAAEQRVARDMTTSALAMNASPARPTHEVTADAQCSRSHESATLPMPVHRDDHPQDHQAMHDQTVPLPGRISDLVALNQRLKDDLPFRSGKQDSVHQKFAEPCSDSDVQHHELQYPNRGVAPNSQRRGRSATALRHVERSAEDDNFTRHDCQRCWPWSQWKQLCRKWFHQIYMTQSL